MSIQTITATELHALWQGGKTVDVIDVRTPAEYREVHALCARLLPLDRLDPAAVMAARNGMAGEPLYVICHSGSRARQACERFVAAGFANVVSVEGGTRAWEEAGLRVVRGRKTLPLERQVRIAAGGLSLLGALLVLVHPAFALVPACVGAGLIFAGVTDRCGMALLLGRLPWNQANDAAPTCCAQRVDA